MNTGRVELQITKHVEEDKNGKKKFMRLKHRKIIIKTKFGSELQFPVTIRKGEMRFKDSRPRFEGDKGKSLTKNEFINAVKNLLPEEITIKLIEQAISL